MTLFYRFLLLFCLTGLGAAAQNYPRNAQNEEVYDNMVSVMDTLLEQFHYRMHYPEKKDTFAMNKYRYAAGEVPAFTPDVYRKRLKEMPSVFQMDYNSKSQTFINLYASRLRRLTSKMLGLQHVYFPIIEEVFEREGLPLELKYLACIESALNPQAVSPAKATGLWQFMYHTAKLYNLRIDSYVDERLDPYKSTVAAAHYLKDLHKIYGDWQLAIAAYNCGPGRVNYALRRSGGKRDFWSLWPMLPRETAGYVPAFIGCAYAMHYATEHNLYPIYADFTYIQDTVHVTDLKISLKQLADSAGADVELLRTLNPELKLGIVPYSSKPYPVRMPLAAAEFYRRNSLAIFHKTVSEEPKKLLSHYVRKGESPASIAQRYSVTEGELRDWNDISGRWVYPGQKLKVYVPESSAIAASPKATKAAAAKPIVHRVQAGDSLWTIAKKYQGVTDIDTLLSLNNLSRNTVLKVGQVLRVTE